MENLCFLDIISFPEQCSAVWPESRCERSRCECPEGIVVRISLFFSLLQEVLSLAVQSINTQYIQTINTPKTKNVFFAQNKILPQKLSQQKY